METLHAILIPLLTILTLTHVGHTYSAIEDSRIIRAYNDELPFLRNHARVARTLVHKSDWTSISTISTDKNLQGFPFVNVLSIADSERHGRSTGDIYFLMTDMDFTGKDWRQNNKVSMLFSNNSDGDACSQRDVDPMEPTCWRTIISGNVVELKKNASGYEIGMRFFLSRHRSAYRWMKEHSFYLAKLDIKNIYVLDFYGGAKHVKVEDYYKSPPRDDFNENDNLINRFDELDNSQTPDEVHIKVKKNRKYKKIFIEV